MSLIGIIFEVVGRSTVHSDLRSEEKVRHNGAGAAAALPCVKTVPDSCLGYEPRAVLLNSRLQVNARRSTRRDRRQRALPTPPTSSRRRAATAADTLCCRHRHPRADALPPPTRCPRIASAARATARSDTAVAAAVAATVIATFAAR